MSESGGRPAVLVVDDEPHICTLIGYALSDEGYDVLCAANGAAALEILRRTRPALVLLDLQMPVMDGPTLIRHYRDLPGPRAPVVVLTASIIPEQNAAALGVDGVLRKPFDVDNLLACVARYAGKPGG